MKIITKLTLFFLFLINSNLSEVRGFKDISLNFERLISKVTKLNLLILFFIFSYSSWSLSDEIQNNKHLIGKIDTIYDSGEEDFGFQPRETKVFIIDTGIDCEDSSCYETYDFALELVFGNLLDEHIPYRLLQIGFFYDPDATLYPLQGPWEIKDVISKYLEWHQVALENEVVDYSKVIQETITNYDVDLRFGSWEDNQIPIRKYVFHVVLEIGKSYPDFFLSIAGETYDLDPDNTYNYYADKDFFTTYYLPHESVLELNQMLNEDYLISQIKKYKNKDEDLDKLFN